MAYMFISVRKAWVRLLFRCLHVHVCMVYVHVFVCGCVLVEARCWLPFPSCCLPYSLRQGQSLTDCLGWPASESQGPACPPPLQPLYKYSNDFRLELFKSPQIHIEWSHLWASVTGVPMTMTFPSVLSLLGDLGHRGVIPCVLREF